MTDFEVMKRYRCAVAEIAVMEKQVERYMTMGLPDGYGTVSLERVGSGTNNRDAMRQQQLDGIIEVLNRKRAELSYIIERFEVIMDRVRPDRLRVILRSYYALGMTDEAIACELDMCTRRVNALRNEFMRSLELPEAA